MTARPQRVHGLAGIVPAGRGKVRAVCFCGHQTSPRTTNARALDALDEHGFTDPVCAVCGRDRGCWIHLDGCCWNPHCCAGTSTRERHRDVRHVADDLGARFVCRDEQDCAAAAARRQVQLDRDALGAAAPAPVLRLVR